MAMQIEFRATDPNDIVYEAKISMTRGEWMRLRAALNPQDIVAINFSNALFGTLYRVEKSVAMAADEPAKDLNDGTDGGR